MRFSFLPIVILMMPILEIAGFIIVGATAAGIVIFSLPTAVVGTELGAFVIASISGYIGSHVLDRLPTGVKT